MEAVKKVTITSTNKKAPMQVARGGLGVAVVNGKIYAIVAFSEDIHVQVIYVYKWEKNTAK